MRIKFIKINEKHNIEILKDSKSDYLVVPNLQGNVTINNKNYRVTALDYDYDLGVITVKLY